jgi:hypothetical protein
MKHVITVFLLIAVIGFGFYYARKLGVNQGAKTAGIAETKGDYQEALAQYVRALYKTIPSTPTPDINRSKTLPPASWKKEMEEYAGWSFKTSPKTVSNEKKQLLLDAIVRNVSRIDTQNFFIADSIKSVTPEQYTALWNKAFFARGVPVDKSHATLAAECYSKAISMIVVSAPISFTYEMSLIDTQTNRRTTFTVYPESSTYVLAGAGNTYILVGESSYQPEPGKIWRSNPSITPITVPPKTSVMYCFVKTWVKRDTTKN